MPVSDQYQPIEPLGERSQSVKALDSANERIVVVRELGRDGLSDDELLRVSRRWERLGQLDHPNLAWSHGLVEADGNLVVVREFVDGYPLPLWLLEYTCETDCRRRVALEVARALAIAHRHEIFHGHLIPDNIIVRSYGRPVITDFGVASFPRPATPQDDVAAFANLFGLLDLVPADGDYPERLLLERLDDPDERQGLDMETIATTLDALWRELPEESTERQDPAPRWKLLVAGGCLGLILVWILLLIIAA